MDPIMKISLILIIGLLLFAFFLTFRVEAYPILDPGSGRGRIRPTPTPTEPPPVWDTQAVKRCLKFLNVVRVTMQDEGWRTDPAFVFGIMAQESKGFVNPNKTLGWGYDRVGSRGLMQIAPFSWRVDDPQKLEDNPRLNIWWGINILEQSVEMSWGNMDMALAIYNCGSEGEKRGCGYDYSERVIYYWAPLFREAFIDGRWKNKLYWSTADQRLIQDWLQGFGYHVKEEK